VSVFALLAFPLNPARCWGLVFWLTGRCVTDGLVPRRYNGRGLLLLLLLLRRPGHQGRVWGRMEGSHGDRKECSGMLREGSGCGKGSTKMRMETPAYPREKS